MANRVLPPLRALRAFETAARSNSFAKAALELSLTQAAVSKQVKLLKAGLGRRFLSEAELAHTHATHSRRREPTCSYRPALHLTC